METNHWKPFHVKNTALIAPRPLHTNEGIGDRLRVAAFAEVQAELGFRTAVNLYSDQIPPRLKDLWLEIADEEAKHRGWLLTRLDELGQSISEQPVTDVLWQSLQKCTDARSFAHYMAGAELRGKRAGERFYEQLLTIDPVSAKIFGQIAKEETRHIEIAYTYFPLNLPLTHSKPFNGPENLS